MPNTWTSTHTARRDRPQGKRTVERTLSEGRTTRHSETAAYRYWDETANVELTIDVEAVIQHLAAKAIRSKAGRSALLGGSIKLKVTKRVESNVRIQPVPLSSGLTIVQPE